MSPWLTSTTARTITSAQWVLKPPRSKQPKLTGNLHHRHDATAVNHILSLLKKNEMISAIPCRMHESV